MAAVSGSVSGTNENLWARLLRETSKRSRLPDGSVHVLGDVGCGKSSLVERLCSSGAAGNGGSESHPLGQHKGQLLDIVGYQFFSLDDNFSNLSSDNLSSNVHLWTYNTKAMGMEIDFVNDLSFSDKNVFMVCIDLSDHDNCITSLKRWIQFILKKVSEAEGKIYESNPGKYSNVRATSQMRRADQFVYKSDPKRYWSEGGITSHDDRNGKGIQYRGTGIGSSELKLREEEVAKTLPFHIVVVGCKSDRLDINNYQVLNAVKVLQGRIRSICLHIGASFISTSASNKTNIDALRRYLQHCLYPDIIPGFEGTEDTIDIACYPLGFDSENLISLSTGLDSNTIKTIVTDFNNSIMGNLALVSGAPANSTSVPDVVLESESEWLAKLQSAFNKQILNKDYSSAPNLSSTFSQSAESRTLSSTTNFKGNNAPLSNPNLGVGTGFPLTSRPNDNSVPFNGATSPASNSSTSPVSPVASIMASINAARPVKRQSMASSGNATTLSSTSQTSGLLGTGMSTEKNEKELPVASPSHISPSVNNATSSLASSRLSINALASSTSSNSSNSSNSSASGSLTGSISRLSLGGSGSATVNSIADSLSNSSSRRSSLTAPLGMPTTPAAALTPSSTFSSSSTLPLSSLATTTSSNSNEKQQTKEEVDDFFKTLLAKKK